VRPRPSHGCAAALASFFLVGCGGDTPPPPAAEPPVDLGAAEAAPDPSAAIEVDVDAAVAAEALVEADFSPAGVDVTPEPGEEGRAAPGIAAAPAAPCDTALRPCFTRPDSVRGIYLNAWASGSTRRIESLIDLARRTEINAFVIDIKDATGFVSHASRVPAVKEVGADGERRIRDLPGLLRRLEAEGIYPIARIVIVKDPLLSQARPELAVQDTAGGVWVDSKKIVWLNLYNEGVWEYHADLAVEVAEMGFPEIQWDYVRFPDAPQSDLERALFPGDSIGPKPEAVRSFLTHAREKLRATGLGVRTTADVFGVTTNVRRDVGIGQVWETFIDRVDAALPMVYPSHYWAGSFGFDEPNAYPYEVIVESIGYAVRRSEAVDSAGEVIPWLQDFTLGPPRYEAPEVRAQIEATYDAGARNWILWNPGSSYTEEALMPAEGWATPPPIRVAGRIVPADRRLEVLAFVADSIAAAEAAAAASTRPRVLPDSVPLRVDTVPDTLPSAAEVGGGGR
jgi:hypothetical protein